MSDDVYNDIVRLIQIRRYPEARQKIKALLSENPGNTYAMYWAAYIHWVYDECKEAIEVCKLALGYDPKDIELRYLLARVYRDESSFAEAEAIIIELIRENPDYGDFFRTYSEIMLYSFNISKARQLIAEAIRLDPESRENQLAATMIDICDGNTDVAASKLQQLIADDPESEAVLRTLAVHLVNQNRHKPALLITQELLRKNPNDRDLVEMIVDLKAVTHWSAWPLWLLNRFGWSASIIMWGVMVLLVTVNNNLDIPGFSYIIWPYIGLVLYSWFHPPIFKKLLQKRGV